MSAHSSIHEEIKEQQQKTKDMSTKGKLSYFWYYYKVHTLVAIVVVSFLIILVRDILSNKDYAFYASVINADYSLLQEQNWSAEFEEYAGIDTKEYQAYIDTSMIFSEDDSSEYALSNMNKLIAMLQSGTIDVIVADTEHFENYAQFEYLMNLEEVLPKEVLEKYQDCFYYTDAATFEDEDDDTLYFDEEYADKTEYIVNHHDPDSMEEPILVGICLPENTKLIASGCYDYLSENGVSYQGYPSQAVLGIPVTSTHFDNTLLFLEYLEED